jgi:16S rRNA (cytidine1402-2'-O)-methyltransferase
MSVSFAAALNAAQAAAADQHYPQGALYVVATPIGNLADISLRALHVLSLCDTLACEDTRHSQSLLRAYGIEPSQKQWLALHQHNEAQASEEVIRRLLAGQRVAYVSDAGTPAVSDPGARLVWQVQAAGLRCVPLPGASSITGLLSCAGTPLPDVGGFVFVGFLPAKGQERQLALDALAHEQRTQVLLEAPHRVESLAQSLAALGERPVTVGRELTKQFEEIATMPAQAVLGWLQASPQRSKGEFVWVIHAQAAVGSSDDQHDALLRLLMADLPVKSAVKLATEITHAPRNALYERALMLRDSPKQ